MGIFGGTFSGSNGGDIFGFATAGMFAGTMEAKKARQQSAAEAAQARQDQQNQQAAIAAQIKSVDESYGKGTSDTAQANAKQLGQYEDKAGQAYQEGNLFNLNDTFGNTLKQSKFALARSGNTGGQEDANTQVNALTGYAQGRNQVADATASYKSGLTSALDTQRAQTDAQISQGLTLDTSGLLDLRQQKANLDQAGSQIPAQAFGNLFAQAGATYGGARISGAYGYGPMAQPNPAYMNSTTPQGIAMPNKNNASAGGFS